VIDSHCHLDVDAFDGDRDAVLERAATAGVEALVVPAVDEPSWEKVLALAAIARPRCHAALGIHPVALPAMRPADDARVLAALEALAKKERPVAIGECGLDTAIDLEAAPLDRQEAVLEAQLAIARSLELPVVLHARGPGSYARLDAFLERVALPARGGVVHSYGGGAELLKKFLARPLLFGFAGPATYPNARKVKESVLAVPDDRLLAETDAPDQTPVPHKPARCEPAFVKDVVEGLAAIRGRTAGEVAALTAGNAKRLFGL
jgi:TatD DNase family protein